MCSDKRGFLYPFKPISDNPGATKMLSKVELVAMQNSKKLQEKETEATAPLAPVRAQV